MPVPPKKRVTIKTEPIDLVADMLQIRGLQAGELGLFVRWREQTPNGAITADSSHSINGGDDLDNNGTGDLAQVWQAARTASGAQITPQEFLDLCTALVHAAAEIRKSALA